jgi:hypothetical protein
MFSRTARLSLWAIVWCVIPFLDSSRNKFANHAEGGVFAASEGWLVEGRFDV